MRGFFNTSPSWSFDHHLDRNARATIPMNQWGLTCTRQEWQAIRDSVDLFYSEVTDDEIEQFNNLQRQALETLQQKPAMSAPKQKADKPGYVYLLHSESGHYKIGKSIDPRNRKTTIGTKMPHKVTLLYTAKMGRMDEAEETLHYALNTFRVNGEWFDLPPEWLGWVTSGTWLDASGLREECEEEERHT